ncbi:MAG TPA: hypothetical protein VEL28_10225 [Candidatus Binatia bacterium]|nr:hypothetical protein [Candidatus Binatia bacterium]
MKFVFRLGFAGLSAVALTFGAGSAHARCIDPNTNTVDDAADCLFVDKSEEDCRLGFAVDMDGTGTPPADPKKIECVDGEDCDADGAVNGKCHFRIGACVNVPTASCAAATGDLLTVTKPSAKDANDAIKRPTAVYNRRTIGDAINAILPSAGQACTDADLPVVVELKAKKGKCGSPANQSCTSDQECDDYCLPSFSASKALVGATLVDADETSLDKAKFKLTCLPATAGAQGAEAFQIADSGDLIGGPLAMGKVGDYMIRNGNIRAVIRGLGREHSFSLLNGGQLIDADLARFDGSQDRDSWQGIQPMINVSSTQATDSIVVVNDGSNGLPAIIESSGPDDLFDTIQPDVLVFTQPPLSVPQSAVDSNLPLQVSTRFILSPYSNYVQVATKVENLGASTLRLYVGDFINPSGQLEPFGPGQGYGETLIRNGSDSASQGQTLDFLAFQGQFDAAGVTYGLVFPTTTTGTMTTRNTSSFSQSGVFAWLNNQNLFDTLFSDPDDKPDGSFVVPAGGENTLRRWFVIGKTVSDVTKVRSELFVRETGAVQGTVTVAGAPVSGAHVTLINNRINEPGACPETTNCVNVYSSTLTDESGFYRIYAPVGSYRIATRSKGTPFEDNEPAPTETPIVIEYKKTALLDVDLPGTATVSISITDHLSNPSPGKVSIVGVPEAADPLNSEFAGGIAEMVGRYFGWPFENKGDAFGLVDVQFAGADGQTGDFLLEPGTYQVVTSRGYEYDVHSQSLTVQAGDDVDLSAVVNRVVDTSGFVSIDTHVHMLNSPDSAVSRERRILTMIAEGVDFFANTDHDFIHDLSDEITAMGVGNLVANAPAAEMTTSQYGHFNAWPQAVNAAEVDGGALDWGRAGEPNGAGYPSDGSYDLSPAEIFGSFNPASQVIQINHFNSDSLGHFNQLAIDTDAVPPVSATVAYRCVGGSFDGNPCEVPICLGGANDGASCTIPANCPGGTCSSPSFGRTCDDGGVCMAAGHPNNFLRLDPSVTNTFDDGFTALEVWIEAGRAQTDLLRSDNMSDWFNLLNQGIYKAGVADSDTHHSVTVQAGGPRTFVASATDDPGSIDPAALAVSVNGMRAIGTNGPFLSVELNNNSGGTAGHALGTSRTVEFDGGGTDSVSIHVEAPLWAEYDRIELYVNSVPSCQSEWNFLGVVNPSSCTVAPTMTLNKGAGFTVNTVAGAFGAGQRQVTDVSVPLTVSADSWVVVVVRGTDGVSHPLFPMQPQDLESAGNTTLAALTDNGAPLPWNLNEEGALALAFSNPLFFDDGDGTCKGGAPCPGM